MKLQGGNLPSRGAGFRGQTHPKATFGTTLPLVTLRFRACQYMGFRVVVSGPVSG